MKEKYPIREIVFAVGLVAVLGIVTKHPITESPLASLKKNNQSGENFLKTETQQIVEIYQLSDKNERSYSDNSADSIVNTLLDRDCKQVLIFRDERNENNNIVCYSGNNFGQDNEPYEPKMPSAREFPRNKKIDL